MLTRNGLALSCQQDMLQTLRPQFWLLACLILSQLDIAQLETNVIIQVSFSSYFQAWKLGGLRQDGHPA
jgi:hypothetical protein